MAEKKNTISTSQIVSAVCEKFDDVPKKVTKGVIVEFINSIEQSVLQGNKVRVDRIGIIQAKERAARKGRNPQTGEVIDIPASKKISFRASKSLKEQVGNGGQEKKKKK